MIRRSEPEGCPRLNRRHIDVDCGRTEIVELVIQNFATQRDVVGHEVLVAGTDEVTVIVAQIVGAAQA